MDNKAVLMCLGKDYATKVMTDLESGFKKKDYDVHDKGLDDVLNIENFDPNISAVLIDLDDAKKNDSIKNTNDLISKLDYVYGDTSLIYFLTEKDLSQEEKSLLLRSGIYCILKSDGPNTVVDAIYGISQRISRILDKSKILKVKDIEINIKTHEVTKDGEPIDLTYTQFKLLYLLASRRNYVYTRDEIRDADSF